MRVQKDFPTNTMLKWRGWYLAIFLVERNVCSLKKVKNKVIQLYRPGVAQRVGRGIALLLHDRATRRG
jgi:phosphoenolpyruvate synthase/pyruvate phosphate dikinase